MIREWNDRTLKRFLKEGRGSGEKSSYKGWLQVQDISSKGRSSRVFCNTNLRIVHLLSDLQLYYFYLLEFDDEVIDIREQYPLLDFHELDIQLDPDLTNKLFDVKTKVPHIFTTSFLITRIDENNNPFYEARAIKTSSELEKKATIERLELQRRYYEKKQINFGVVTEKEINKQMARNIGWVLTVYDIEDYPDLVGNLVYLKRDMLSYLSSSQETFQSIFQRLEKSYQLKEGLALILYKHLVATRQIKLDMTKKIDLSSKLDKYSIQIPYIEMEGDNHAIGG